MDLTQYCILNIYACTCTSFNKLTTIISMIFAILFPAPSCPTCGAPIDFGHTPVNGTFGHTPVNNGTFTPMPGSNLGGTLPANISLTATV